MQLCSVLAQKISFCVPKIMKIYLNYFEILFAFVRGDECKNNLTIILLITSLILSVNQLRQMILSIVNRNKLSQRQFQESFDI